MKNLFLSVSVLIALTVTVSCASSPTDNTPQSSAAGDTVYVSSSGNDANDGFTPTSPKQTLNAALTLAKQNNAQYLKISGDFTLTAGASNAGFYIGQTSNLVISGGWNASFSGQTSASVLNGNSVCGHVVFIDQGYNITLSNFVLTGGNGSDDYGGGLSCYQSVSILLFCTVSNNTQRSGGGICFRNSFSNTISGLVSGNNANGGSGGGIYLVDCHYNSLNITVTENTGTYGGGIYLSDSHSNTVAGTISSNTSSGGSAGGLRTDFSRDNTISAAVMYNRATSNGGGMLIYYSTNNTIAATCVIQYNHCDNDDNASGTGGAVNVMGGTGNAILLGAVYSPNFLGSASTNTNDLVGIAAP